MYQGNIAHLKFKQYSIQLFINTQYLSMIFKVQLLNISVSIVLKKKTLKFTLLFPIIWEMFSVHVYPYIFSLHPISPSITPRLCIVGYRFYAPFIL